MTEAEWLACTAPGPMLTILAHGSGRKLRLFGLECCRRIWHLLSDERSRAAVEFVERFADVGVAGRKGRPATEKAAEAARREADARSRQSGDPVQYGANMARAVAAVAAQWVVKHHAMDAAYFPAEFSALAVAWASVIPLQAGEVPQERLRPVCLAEGAVQCAILRDIFDNPPRPVAVAPAWLAWNGGTVPRLAHAIYEEQAFERLPVLADALEEAGCTDPDLLGHCRQPGEHVRGCWGLDLLQGKS